LPDDRDDLESWLAGHVSSCIIHSNIKPGYHVTKGEELGTSNTTAPTASSFDQAQSLSSPSRPSPSHTTPSAPLVVVRSKLATANMTP
jgi:phosphatidylserine decarboxylase